MKLVELIVLTSIVLSLALLMTIAYVYLTPGSDVRALAKFYLVTTYNPWVPQYTVNSPEAVTAIVWDYRGLDTLFETAVFYLALVAGLMLARRLYSETASTSHALGGLSVIVKMVTKVTAPMIVAVGASIGLHGHLTPGGGFQGGATIAVAPMLILVIFSTFYMLSHGVTTDKMLLVRGLGLIGIGATSISVFIIGLVSGHFAYVFQNMPKQGAPVGLPSHVNGTLISGTLWFFNLFEMLAVAAGFTMAFIALMLVGKGEQS